jgi:hypothetical protein
MFWNIKTDIIETSAIAMKKFIPRFGAYLKSINLDFDNNFILLEDILRAATELEMLRIGFYENAVIYMKNMPILHRVHKVSIRPVSKAILNLLREIAPNVTVMEIGTDGVGEFDERDYNHEYEELSEVLPQAIGLYRQIQELTLNIYATFDEDMANSICELKHLEKLQMRIFESGCDFSTFITQLKNNGQLKSFSFEGVYSKKLGLLNMEYWTSLRHLKIHLRFLQPGQDLGNITSFKTYYDYPSDESRKMESIKFSSLKRFNLRLAMSFNIYCHREKKALSQVIITHLGAIDRCAPELKDMFIESQKESLELMMNYVKDPDNFVNIKRFVFKEIHSNNFTVLMKQEERRFEDSENSHP